MYFQTLQQLMKTLRQLDTWLERRMPPFVGSPAEKRALAVYLARLSGDTEAGIRAPAPITAAKSGREVFDEACAACHAKDALWPIKTRLGSRSRDELYEILGRLPDLQPDMPPFEGTEEERRALADLLADIASGKEQP